MKAFALALLVVIAGVSALPEFNSVESRAEERLVTSQIEDALENVKQQIQDAGLDPYIIENYSYQKTVLPLFIEAQAYLESLEFSGLSNIKINSLDFSLLSRRLKFDIALPELYLSVVDSGVSAVVFGSAAKGSLRGSVLVEQVRVTGQIRVYIGIISGVSLRDVDVKFSLGGVQSNLNISLLGHDFSSVINNALGVDIPAYIKQNEKLINNILEEKITEVAKQYL